MSVANGVPVQLKAWDNRRLLNPRCFGLAKRTRSACTSLTAGRCPYSVGMTVLMHTYAPVCGGRHHSTLQGGLNPPSLRRGWRTDLGDGTESAPDRRRSRHLPTKYVTIS